MILERLKASAQEKLDRWAQSQGLDAPSPVAWAAAPEHVPADVSMPWPLATAKRLKRDPLITAKEVAALLRTLPGIHSAEAAPPGFANVRLTPEALVENLRSALTDPDYGRVPGVEPRKVLIEFVSANPTGPVHLASGRAATLGDSLVRILRRRGHKADSEYYVNDVGRQVTMLGLSVKARWEQLHGKDSPMPEDGYQGEYIKDLAGRAPAEAEGWTAEKFSEFAVETMLAAHRKDMESFGVKFDRWFRESELHQVKALDKALDQLKALGKVYEKEDAVWLGSSEGDSGDDKDRVLVRSDKRPTYVLADIAYHQNKLARGFTELIDILGADHHGYVPRMKAAISALGYPAGTFHAIVHQLVHLFRGKVAVKMSKRAGEFITLKELVEEAGLDACRFFFALRTPNSHMNFDVELARKQSQENPVYYVQYVHARICSIFREAEERGLLAPELKEEGKAPVIDGALLSDKSERALLVKLAWFPEALRLSEKELSPHPLANYLMELASLYHPFYERCRVVDETAPDVSKARLALCGGVKRLIADGLGLLGVSSPQKM